LVLTSITLAACGDNNSPVEVSTVRLAVVPGAHHGGAPYTTEMTTETWHTPRAYEGDVDGTGSALITVNRGQKEVCWHLTVSDIDLPGTSAHIHRAAPGVQGPIVVPLSPPDGTGESSGCASGVDQALLKEIVDSPGSFYVNVHNAAYPPGAVRGQLGR
jgi:hypothetical protein